MSKYFIVGIPGGSYSSDALRTDVLSGIPEDKILKAEVLTWTILGEIVSRGDAVVIVTDDADGLMEGIDKMELHGSRLDLMKAPDA